MSLINFKGTPGNWETQNSIGKDMVSIFAAAHQGYKKIASLEYHTNEMMHDIMLSPEEAQANGKLISSAPLLAEALQDIVNFIQTYGIYDSSGKSLLEDIGFLEPQLAALKAAGL